MLSFDEAKCKLDCVIAARKLPVPASDGPYLVGGAVRRALLGDTGSIPDFDYVCRSTNQLRHAGANIVKVHRSQTAQTYKATRGAIVQDLHLRRLSDDQPVIEEISKFDFGMSRFWYDGDQIRCVSSLDVTDVRHKTLRFYTSELPLLSAYRAVKFIAQGWTLTEEQAQLLSRAVSNSVAETESR